MQQALGIEQHQLVKLPPLRFSYLESLQRLKVEPDGRDRRLQFMGDRVDETVMLLIAANFTDEKNRIEDEPGDEGAKKNDTKKHFDALAPVEDDPTAADRERHRRQANAQREEEINRFLPADDPHRRLVAGGRTGVRSPVQGVRGRMEVFRGC